MARKSRSIIQTAKPRVQVWRIAIYIRLSKEDARCMDESESVSNQRKIIEEHIEAFDDHDEYVIVLTTESPERQMMSERAFKGCSLTLSVAESTV